MKIVGLGILLASLLGSSSSWAAGTVSSGGGGTSHELQYKGMRCSEDRRNMDGDFYRLRFALVEDGKIDLFMSYKAGGLRPEGVQANAVEDRLIAKNLQCDQLPDIFISSNCSTENGETSVKILTNLERNPETFGSKVIEIRSTELLKLENLVPADREGLQGVLRLNFDSPFCVVSLEF